MGLFPYGALRSDVQAAIGDQPNLHLLALTALPFVREMNTANLSLEDVLAEVEEFFGRRPKQPKQQAQTPTPAATATGLGTGSQTQQTPPQPDPSAVELSGAGAVVGGLGTILGKPKPTHPTTPTVTEPLGGAPPNVVAPKVDITGTFVPSAPLTVPYFPPEIPQLELPSLGIPPLTFDPSLLSPLPGPPTLQGLFEGAPLPSPDPFTLGVEPIQAGLDEFAIPPLSLQGFFEGAPLPGPEPLTLGVEPLNLEPLTLADLPEPPAPPTIEDLFSGFGDLEPFGGPGFGGGDPNFDPLIGGPPEVSGSGINPFGAVSGLTNIGTALAAEDQEDVRRALQGATGAAQLASSVGVEGAAPVATALNLGTGAFDLAQNWDQMNDEQRAAAIGTLALSTAFPVAAPIIQGIGAALNKVFADVPHEVREALETNRTWQGAQDYVIEPLSLQGTLADVLTTLQNAVAIRDKIPEYVFDIGLVAPDGSKVVSISTLDAPTFQKLLQDGFLPRVDVQVGVNQTQRDLIDRALETAILNQINVAVAAEAGDEKALGILAAAQTAQKERQFTALLERFAPGGFGTVDFGTDVAAAAERLGLPLEWAKEFIDRNEAAKAQAAADLAAANNLTPEVAALLLSQGDPSQFNIATEPVVLNPID